MTWTQHDAISMCEVLESIVPGHGAHVALTGGCLYKAGLGGRVPRKDCDVLFYRIRQRKCIDMAAMWTELEKYNFIKVSGFGWCYKALYHGKPVDCFFPEGERDANGDEIEYQAVVVDECPF